MADVTDDLVASTARIGYGFQFKVGQGDSPETFTAVPMVNSITPGDMTTEVTDVTHLRSPGRHREKRGTIRDSGPIALECDYDPEHGAHKLSGGDGFAAGHSLAALWRSVAENNFILWMPDPDADIETVAQVQIAIRGTITKYQLGAATLTDPMKVMIEITPLRDYSDGLPA